MNFTLLEPEHLHDPELQTWAREIIGAARGKADSPPPADLEDLTIAFDHPDRFETEEGEGLLHLMSRLYAGLGGDAVPPHLAIWNRRFAGRLPWAMIDAIYTPAWRDPLDLLAPVETYSQRELFRMYPNISRIAHELSRHVRGKIASSLATAEARDAVEAFSARIGALAGASDASRARKALVRADVQAAAIERIATPMTSQAGKGKWLTLWQDAGLVRQAISIHLQKASPDQRGNLVELSLALSDMERLQRNEWQQLRTLLAGAEPGRKPRTRELFQLHRGDGSRNLDARFRAKTIEAYLRILAVAEGVRAGSPRRRAGERRASPSPDWSIAFSYRGGNPIMEAGRLAAALHAQPEAPTTGQLAELSALYMAGGDSQSARDVFAEFGVSRARADGALLMASWLLRAGSLPAYEEVLIPEIARATATIERGIGKSFRRLLPAAALLPVADGVHLQRPEPAQLPAQILAAMLSIDRGEHLVITLPVDDPVPRDFLRRLGLGWTEQIVEGRGSAPERELDVTISGGLIGLGMKEVRKRRRHGARLYTSAFHPGEPSSFKEIVFVDAPPQVEPNPTEPGGGEALQAADGALDATALALASTLPSPPTLPSNVIAFPGALPSMRWPIGR